MRYQDRKAMSAEVWWFLNFFLFSYLSTTLASIPHRKFEYKYSFKPPYLAQKDGSVPFWEYGGNAIASAENVRVVPSLRSQKGAIWTKSKTTFDWWEVDLVFRVTGRGRIGADGLAFWYVENKGAYDGPVFGSSDKWVGLGLFFDSFDNDNKHNNPYIMAMANDGTKEYDHANDGSWQMLSGCVKDFRNKPFPTRAKIEYYMNTLTVLFHNGMTNSDQDYEICLRVENLFLPKAGYFGISAATGGLADDHDVLYFLTTSLYPPGTQPPAPSVQVPKLSQEEEVKLTKEYQEFQKKLDLQKEEYKKDHPDAENEFDDWFESDSQRELKQIFSGMSQIFDQVKLISQKIDEVVGRQERALGLISTLHQSGGVQQQVVNQQGLPPPPAGQPLAIDTIRRHEVDAVLSNQNSIIAQARELKGYLLDVVRKTESLSQQGGGGGGAPQSQETTDMLREIKEGMGSLRQQVPQTGIQSCPTCITPLVLFLAFFGHLVVMFIYLLYRDNKGAQAKKFY